MLDLLGNNEAFTLGLLCLGLVFIRLDVEYMLLNLASIHNRFRSTHTPRLGIRI